MLNDSTQNMTAVMYLRTGTANSGGARAVAHQRDGCKRIAAKYGCKIIREYNDHDCQAILAQQTGLLHLLEDLARHRDAAYVIVWDYARLGDSMEQLEEVIWQIRACGADVATIRGVEAADRYHREPKW